MSPAASSTARAGEEVGSTTVAGIVARSSCARPIVEGRVQDRAIHRVTNRRERRPGCCVPGISRTFVPSASITMRRRLLSGHSLPAEQQLGPVRRPSRPLRGDGIVREDAELRAIQSHRGDLRIEPSLDRERNRRAVGRDVRCRGAEGTGIDRSDGSIRSDDRERQTRIRQAALAGADPSLPRFNAFAANNAIAATITAATANALILRLRACRRCRSS